MAPKPAVPDPVDLTSDEPTTAHTTWRSPGGLPIRFERRGFLETPGTASPQSIRQRLELVRLGLLRGFDQLLCLEGLTSVEHLPHQIETVRKVLRHFQGRVLLADEVGLGKTIEACLLLREYILRGLARQVLILVPAPLVSQWHEELSAKFRLDFTVATRGGHCDSPEFWRDHDRVLASLALAKQDQRSHWITAKTWDLVIVDEAHHCKNRATKNWQLINAIPRRHLFLLTATPVQNNLLELYNLLTLLEPGHLKTEADFKKQYVRRGNPRDPRNRERLRGLLGEVMVRNTRSLVQMNLPPRYAQTLLAEPQGAEAELHRSLGEYLRRRQPPAAADDEQSPAPSSTPPIDNTTGSTAATVLPPLSRKQLSTLLATAGSHPRALAASLENILGDDPAAQPIISLAKEIPHAAKDERLLELLHQSPGGKLLVFANFRKTLEHLAELLRSRSIPFTMFTGSESATEKDAAVDAFRDRVPVMLCSESGGEGRNLQFANTLVNYDLPWNPMRIEQRVGRIHRIGQTRDVFIFNLCTAGSLEAQMLDVLTEKIRMFELVVGEVGSILGNLDGGEEFETLVLDLWLRSRDTRELESSFSQLGESLLAAQQAYLESKELDEALFGDDYE